MEDLGFPAPHPADGNFRFKGLRPSKNITCSHYCAHSPVSRIPPFGLRPGGQLTPRAGELGGACAPPVDLWGLEGELRTGQACGT